MPIIDKKQVNPVYILSVDAKDIYLANNYINENPTGYNVRYKNGDINTKKYINVIDYSLDLMELREVYEKIYRRTNFGFKINDKEYTQRAINVTFNYSNKTFNKVRNGVYVKFGYAFQEVEFNDNVCIKDNQLIAIQTDVEVASPISNEMLGKEFYYEDGAYKAKKNLPVLDTVAQLRTKLYETGFICDGIKYIRFKRSSGSSRVGKCLFIDEKMYDKFHKWEMCGLEVEQDEDVDLAALEAYIALPSSSIIDTIEINPENFLLIKDFKSTFTDDVIVTKLNGNWLESYPDNVEISNSIWDGQSLMDKSLFGEDYDKYGMLLLRNKFFKSCCFNTNIQKWLKDNDITEISQLNGFTLAKDIKDIKLITTPSSIKYLKFSTIEKWLKNIDTTFGVVKHEKPTHYFDGRLVQTHYQLLNTLQLSYEDTKRLIQPSLDYVTLLKTDPSALRYQIKYPEDETFEITPLNSKNDIIYKMLGINNKFSETKLYNNFKNDLVKSYIKNLRCGHLLIEGNYSTLLGNPVEMLQYSILDKEKKPQFKGESILGKGNIHTIRFDFGKTLIGSRSPHVTMGNILLAKNVQCKPIDDYFNITNEIVCINSIKENILERLSSCDFDSDTMMLSDQPILISAAKKNYDKFKVPTSLVTAEKKTRKYNNKEKADLDIKTSVNKIGEIINLSQELNSKLWDNINRGQTLEENLELYYDIAKLDVMSCIEIDKAKKEFLVDNVAEMRKIKEKYDIKDKEGRTIKPHFFGELAKQKGYYDTDKKNYKPHKTTMDYLQKCINSYQCQKGKSKNKNEFCKFSDILKSDEYDTSKIKYEQLHRIVGLVRDMNTEVKRIWKTQDELDNSEKYKMASNVKQECIEYINGIQISKSSMYWLLTLIENPEYSDVSKALFNTFFGTPNKTFFELIQDSKENLEVLQESQFGNIEIYGIKFKKII